MSARIALLSLAVSAVLVAMPAAAQQKDNTVAKLIEMKGDVMVTVGDGMAAGKPDQRVVEGTRVTTMAGGEVIVRYDAGCDVKLKENERFTVRKMGECGALMKEVVALGATGGAIGAAASTTTGTAAAAAGTTAAAAGGTVAAAGTAAGLSTGVVVGGALVAAGAGVAIYNSNKSTSNSPN